HRCTQLVRRRKDPVFPAQDLSLLPLPALPPAAAGAARTGPYLHHLPQMRHQLYQKELTYSTAGKVDAACSDMLRSIAKGWTKVPWTAIRPITAACASPWPATETQRGWPFPTT